MTERSNAKASRVSDITTAVDRARLLLLLLLPIAVFLCESWHVRPQLDDAYISYQYARNLVEGHGLVFNVGEYVEGYTNLLWTLLVAGGIALGFNAPIAAHVLGLGSGVATLVAIYVYGRAGLPRSHAWLAAVPVWLVASSTTFAYWSVSGMETAMYAAAVTAALAAFAHDRPGLATLLAAIATLTRPEGGLVAAIILASQLLALRFRGLAAWRWPILYAAFLAAVTAFRLIYYGSPLPNTFYAKVGGVPVARGVEYVRIFLREGAFWLVLPAAIGALSDRRLRPGGIFALAHTAYVVLIGGDVFEYSRFLLPVLVGLAVFAVRGAEAAYRLNRYAGVALALTIPSAISREVFGTVPSSIVLGMAVLALGWVATLRSGRPMIVRLCGLTLAATAVLALIRAGGGSAYEGLRRSHHAQAIDASCRSIVYQDRYNRLIADALHREQPPPRLIASGGIGRLGYYTRLPVLDIHGLVDATIARSAPYEGKSLFILPGHHRSNADYVFSREPDILIIPQPGTYLPLPALVAMWKHPALTRDYAWDAKLGAYRRRRPAS